MNDLEPIDLVAKAKSLKRKTPDKIRPQGFLELAIACANGDVTANRATKAAGFKGVNCFTYAVIVELRRAIAEGKVKPIEKIF